MTKDLPKIDIVEGEFLNNDQFYFAMIKKYPDLEPWKDWVFHSKWDGEPLVQIGHPTIEKWNTSKYPMPSDEEIVAFFETVRHDHKVAVLTNDAAKRIADELDFAGHQVMAAEDGDDAKAEAAWRDYRKQLRGIPQADGFPADIKWPVRPSEVK